MIETAKVGKFKNQTTGETCTVIRERTVRTFKPINGPVEETKGSPGYKTSTGAHLNRLSDDESKFATLDNPPQILVLI